MAELVKYLKETKDCSLNFVNIDLNSMRLILFTDAAFANTKGLGSQVGFVLVLADATGKCNILHYGSATCRRVTRSVMAAELLGLVYGYDNAFIVKHTLESCFGTKIRMDAYVDSRTVFNTVAKGKGTLEKRLQIDAFAIREAHRKGDLTTLGWVPGKENPADGLTRKNILSEKHPLIMLMTSNFIVPKPQG